MSSLTGQEPGGTVRSTPVMSVFARPRTAMQEREDGCLLLRSADPRCRITRASPAFLLDIIVGAVVFS